MNHPVVSGARVGPHGTKLRLRPPQLGAAFHHESDSIWLLSLLKQASYTAEAPRNDTTANCETSISSRYTAYSVRLNGKPAMIWPISFSPYCGMCYVGEGLVFDYNRATGC